MPRNIETSPSLFIKTENTTEVAILLTAIENRRVINDEKIAQIADDITDHTIRRSYSMLEAVYGVYCGIWYLNNGQQKLGTGILAAIEDELSRQEITHKLVYPLEMNEDIYGRHTILSRQIRAIDADARQLAIKGKQHPHQDLCILIEDVASHRGITTPAIADLILQVDSIAQKGPINIQSILSTIIPKRQEYVEGRKHHQMNREKNHYAELFQRIVQLEGLETQQYSLWKESIKIGIEIIAHKSSIDALIPHIYTLKHGDVSLQDILTAESHEGATTQFLTYVRAMPKGNVIYDRLIKALFLNMQAFPLGTTPQLSEEEHTVFKRLIAIQNNITWHTLAPALKLQEEDAHTDNELKQAFTSLSKSTQNHVSMMMHLSAMYGANTLLLLKPEAIQALPMLHPFAYAILQNLHDTTALYDQRVIKLFAQQKNQIANSLHERFGQAQWVNFFLVLNEETGNIDFRAEHTEAVYQLLISRTNREFLQTLDERKGELEQAIQKMKESSVQEQTHTLFSLFPHIRRTFIFEEKSTAKTIGLDYIVVSANPDNQINFLVKMVDPQLSFTGHIDGRTSEIIELSADLNTQNPSINILIQSFIHAIYHDMTRQLKHIVEQHSKSPKISRPRQLYRNTSSGVRTLPRTYNWPAEVLDNQQKTNEVITQLQQKQQEQNIPVRIFDSKPVYLAYAARYKRAVEAYLKSNDHAVITEINYTREKMHQISDKKKSNLPPQFRNVLETITDPFTGESINLQTWRVEYTVPKIPVKEYQSLAQRYELYYKNQGSALALMEELIEWIIT